jgi:hypothetical protein
MRPVTIGLLAVTMAGCVLLAGGLTGCGAQPRSIRAAATAPGRTTPPAAAGTARPIGSEQDLRTPELAAQVTVRETMKSNAAYVVKVTVHIQHGTWEFGPTLLRLQAADGTTSVPAHRGALPAGALTLHDGVTRTWQIPFGHPAGADARLVLTTPAGTALTWTTQ